MKREGGVIISVYVESLSSKDSKQRSNPWKRIHPKPFLTRPSTSRKRSYDRRAQLLNYAHALRHANYQHLSWKSNNSSNQKHKKWRWTRRIRLSFSRLFHRKDKEWRYEHIGTHGEESCCQNGLKWRKLGGAKRKTTHICTEVLL
ncbi:PREDICTED: uncharacterized protein LOC109230398 isoform X2 [Nicotiana attenuata]|uniref:uncharacterized protein LOC109230398 isoform X2 n=1 Tax=Nicotiana attenuata TaxID=49451 RepID=UPI0009049CE4|nr:PREDICTED: uncharacterized protein LOC109230398 isoform X2 [Nicotiana attenuata]